MKALLDKPRGWFIEWLRKVWLVRGGGLYAFGFVATFVLLEFQSLADDVLEIGSLFNGQAVAFVIQFFIDSLSNTIRSFVWPVFVLQIAPPFGAIALGLGFVWFARFLKQPIEAWLFPHGVPETAKKKQRAR